MARLNSKELHTILSLLLSLQALQGGRLATNTSLLDMEMQGSYLGGVSLGVGAAGGTPPAALAVAVVFGLAGAMTALAPPPIVGPEGCPAAPAPTHPSSASHCSSMQHVSPILEVFWTCVRLLLRAGGAARPGSS